MRALNFAAVAVAASLIAAPASAALVVATYSGTASGTDDLGIFGGGTLTDVAFTATFQYDTTLGNRSTTAFADTLTAGGTQPVFFAEITVGDATFTWDSLPSADASASVSFVSNYYRNYVDQVFNDTSGPLDVARRRQVDLFAFFTPAPSSLDSFVDQTGDLGQSNLWFGDITTLDPITQEVSTVATALSLSTTALSVEVNGAIPEPSTWAMMILGFGSAGAMLRRRRLATELR